MGVAKYGLTATAGADSLRALADSLILGILWFQLFGVFKERRGDFGIAGVNPYPCSKIAQQRWIYILRPPAKDFKCPIPLAALARFLGLDQLTLCLWIRVHNVIACGLVQYPVQIFRQSPDPFPLDLGQPFPRAIRGIAHVV